MPRPPWPRPRDLIQTNRARFPRGKRARFVARAVYELLEHHPVPATKAPQPRPLPGERAHIIRQGGQQLVVVWCTIIYPESPPLAGTGHAIYRDRGDVSMPWCWRGSVFVPGTVAVFVPYRIMSRSPDTFSVDPARIFVAASVFVLSVDSAALWFPR